MELKGKKGKSEKREINQTINYYYIRKKLFPNLYQ